jgi:hypothetical protein
LWRSARPQTRQMDDLKLFELIELQFFFPG